MASEAIDGLGKIVSTCCVLRHTHKHRATPLSPIEFGGAGGLCGERHRMCARFSERQWMKQTGKIAVFIAWQLQGIKNGDMKSKFYQSSLLLPLLSAWPVGDSAVGPDPGSGAVEEGDGGQGGRAGPRALGGPDRKIVCGGHSSGSLDGFCPVALQCCRACLQLKHQALRDGGEGPGLNGLPGPVTEVHCLNSGGRKAQKRCMLGGTIEESPVDDCGAINNEHTLMQ